MHGGIKYQVSNIFNTISAIGESKHQAKKEIEAQFAEKNIKNTYHNLGKELGIHSYSTMENYFKIGCELMHFAKENFKIKDILLLNNEHVNAFLEHKIEQKIKFGTFQIIAAAMEKLEVALNAYVKKYSSVELHGVYKFDLKDTRQLAIKTLERSVPHRAYQNPKVLIKIMTDPAFRIIAQAQLEGGFRIREINYLKLSQFNENQKTIEVQGKGGYKREIKLSETTYAALKSLVLNTAEKKFIFSENLYRKSLSDAAFLSGQTYTGSHGLRWNFAQNRMLELQKSGRSFNEARFIVSSDLGHHRADITSHYLR